MISVKILAAMVQMPFFISFALLMGPTLQSHEVRPAKLGQPLPERPVKAAAWAVCTVARVANDKIGMSIAIDMKNLRNIS